MGKKGSWFSAIKRALTPHPKEKPASEFEKRNKREKNKGVGKLRNGESNSFIPLFREPSSVEKIFLDFETEQQRVAFRPSTPPTPPFVTPRNTSPRTSSARRASPTVSPPRAASPRVVNRPKSFRFRPEPTLRNHHASATKIQAVYRGYMARRSFRALKGLVRLQGVVRGQNVKRQTANAMKQMQLLVRVQSQIQSRRIQMLETQARHHHKINDKDADTALGKWSFTQPSEAGNQDDWDDSLLTREEIEARLQRKAEAIIKRERAMAYAYSHQLWKASPNSTQSVLADIRSAGFPWWWNWLERQLPPSNASFEPQTLKNFLLAPQTPQPKQTPPSNNKQHHIASVDNIDQTPTPKSTKSTILPTAKLSRNSPSFRTSPAAFRTPPASARYSRPRGMGVDSPFDMPLKDDDSLISCPPFSVPHYMAPTVSAKAKLRGSSTPKVRSVATPSNESKRRVLFPFTQGLASFKWNKGSLFSNKDSPSQRNLDNSQSLQAMANLSVDSTASLPVGIGRKPFNRFV